jgi:hypothetical protein
MNVMLFLSSVIQSFAHPYSAHFKIQRLVNLGVSGPIIAQAMIAISSRRSRDGLFSGGL